MHGLSALICAVLISACSGPKPQVQSVKVMSPKQEGDPYLVDALVQNEGGGEGQAEVDVRLKNHATGEKYHQEELVDLKEGESLHVVVEVHAPPGNYLPEVEAQYPPR